MGWLGDVLDRIFSALTGGSGGLVIGIVLLVAAVALLVVLASAVRRGRGVPGRRPTGPASPQPVLVDRSREPAQWRQDAEEHARAGRWREAVRCRYRALVGDLARRGLLDEIPGRTTGEERAELAVAAPAVAPSFARATDLFDQAWYGQAAVGADDDERFRRWEAEVLEAAR